MLSHPLNASRCLNSLLRYELAAVRCYQFAERAVTDEADLAVLSQIRRDHETAADRLRELVTADGASPSADPGMWGVLTTQVETAAAVFGRKAMLTVLLWTEQHAADTYESSGRVPGSICEETPPVSENFRPMLLRHIAALEPLIARCADRPSKPCGEFARPELLNATV
jgi:hypothetical protein